MKRRQLQKEFRGQTLGALARAAGTGLGESRRAGSQMAHGSPRMQSDEQEGQRPGVREQQLVQEARGPVNSVLYKQVSRHPSRVSRNQLKCPSLKLIPARTRDTACTGHSAGGRRAVGELPDTGPDTQKAKADV